MAEQYQPGSFAHAAQIRAAEMAAEDISGVEHELLVNGRPKTCIWCGGPVVRAEKWRKGEIVYATLRCRWCLRQGGAL